MKDKREYSPMEAAYESFLSAIREYRMEERIERGVLVGFSGGPDSVLLLTLLLRYKEKHPFSLLAVHVNHEIRGENADRDEKFAKEFCEARGVEFHSVRMDVPSLARTWNLGIEESARIARYSCFCEIIQSRKDLFSIALGHNATDNVETVLFHLLRGCGTGGLAGIPPVRDNIIRPLLSLPKEKILSALEEQSIPCVFDETNADVAYTRNYIRNEILPRLSRLSSSPEVSVQRVCRNLICDNDFIESVALESYATIKDGKASRAMLAALHPAVLARVLLRLGNESGVKLACEHITAIETLLKTHTPFSYDVPNGMRLVADRDVCWFVEKHEGIGFCQDEFSAKILPDCPISLVRGAFSVSYGECKNISPNIYNFSIKVNLASVIIVGELFLRYRRNGDSYYYGGMTHKLKKIFNDRKMPLHERETLPILCDEKGIVWVPGFGVRDDGVHSENALNAAFFF